MIFASLNNAKNLQEFTFHLVRLIALGLGLGLLLAITPVLCWLLIPFLALYAAGYRIVNGKNDWTDDIEEYLAAVEENK